MIEEIFSDTERLLLIVLVEQAMGKIQSDPDMDTATQECHDILSKLYGTDTVLIARRADRSCGYGQARDRSIALYHDPRFPERNCDHCGKPYTGPAVFCSLTCAEAAA